MLSSETIEIVQKYLIELRKNGINFTKAFIYGSQATGKAGSDSDIDLMIISPLFDNGSDKLAAALWISASKISYKIEPIGIGKKKDLTPMNTHL